MPRYSHTYAISLLLITSFFGSPFLVAEEGDLILSESAPVIMSVPASPEYAVRDTPDIVIESMNISMSTPIPYEAPSVGEKEKVPVSDTVDHTSPEHETSDTIHLSVDDAEEIGGEASPEEVAVGQESVENLPEEDLGTLPIIEPFIEPSDPVIAEPFADTYVETPVITPTTPRSIQLTITLPSVEG